MSEVIHGDPHDVEDVIADAEAVQEESVEKPAETEKFPEVQGDPHDVEGDVDADMEAPEMVDEVKADKIVVHDAVVKHAEGRFVDVKDGVIGMAVGENITLSDGVLAIASTQTAKVTDGVVVFAAANEIGGDATVIFDLRAAVLFGFVLGLVMSLFKLFSDRKAA